MNLCKSLTHSIKICTGILVLGIGTISSSMSAFAQEEIITDPKPLEIHTGTIQDLDGTESKAREEWLGGVGGQYAATEGTRGELTRYQFNQTVYEAKTEALDITLEEHDSHLGDVERPTRRIPLIQF
ncbi:hypothetical protein [cyanobacterium endosymbiont of Rhopalodia gibberula]|uniref:hypothetical protein n=1 Tax=cyanobacterium endosymbiont of Rhopalodia gibberula TaxID=1763363 RepID=UPI000E652F60|nr:hypothetical protein [cyanobacterium endosymbiont of Rhopalodia gibberula]